MKKFLSSLSVAVVLSLPLAPTTTACKPGTTPTQIEQLALEGADLACAVDQLIQGNTQPAAVATACNFVGDPNKVGAVTNLINNVLAAKQARLAKTGGK